MNQRHAAALRAAAACVDAARGGSAEGRGPELVAADLRAALAELRETTGEDHTRGVLNRIFADFCIGK